MHPGGHLGKVSRAVTFSCVLSGWYPCWRKTALKDLNLGVAASVVPAEEGALAAAWL